MSPNQRVDLHGTSPFKILQQDTAGSLPFATALGSRSLRHLGVSIGKLDWSFSAAALATIPISLSDKYERRTQ
jgi:hypothetical protein